MDELAAKIYQSVARANEAREFKMWHASSLAECPRTHYFLRLGVAKQNYVGAGKMLRWKAGHLFEEAIRPHLQEVYPDLISNQRLESTKFDLTGEYDNYCEAEETIIEDKTVHDYAFQYRKKDDPRFRLKDDKPYLNHELQNHGYVKLLREKGKPVSFITYVYITLDGRIATYKTAVNPRLLNEVERRLKVLNTAWAKQEPHECICKEGHELWKNTMQYCAFRSGDECCSLNLIKDKVFRLKGEKT